MFNRGSAHFWWNFIQHASTRVFTPNSGTLGLIVWFLRLICSCAPPRYLRYYPYSVATKVAFARQRRNWQGDKPIKYITICKQNTTSKVLQSWPCVFVLVGKQLVKSSTYLLHKQIQHNVVRQAPQVFEGHRPIEESVPDVSVVSKGVEVDYRQRALLTPTQIHSERSSEGCLAPVTSVKPDPSVVIERASTEKSRTLKLPKQTTHQIGVST